MNEINKDVLAINNSIDYLVNTCESLGIAERSIEVLHNETAINSNDLDRIISATDRMEATRDSLKDDKAQAIENVKQAFEHYYS